MCSPETRYENINNIRPSELYLSSLKLKKIGSKEHEIGALPVKQIAGELFYLDGHHRAYKLYMEGREEVKVYDDEDNLDWLEYLICVNWCRDEGIDSIADLGERIVEEALFKKLWLDRCKEMHEQVDDDRFQFIDFKEEDDPDTKSEVCSSILKDLPVYFGIEKAVKEYIQNVRDKYFVTVRVGTIPVGFIALKEHNEFTSEIYVMGIVEELHGRGIGKKLMEKVEEHLIGQDKKYLTVKTLAPSNPDEGYKKTRAFYRSVGFDPLEEFTDLWGEDNPCLFMIKTLS